MEELQTLAPTPKLSQKELNIKGREIFDKVVVQMYTVSKYSDYIFYAHILGQCSIKFTDEIPTAGVGWNIDHFDFVMNPFYLHSLEFEKNFGLIKHELLHILYDHTGRKDYREHDIWNIACDIAINQQIRKEQLPETECHYDNPKFNFPPSLNAEQYYELLLENPEIQKMKEEQQALEEALGSMDTHEMWDDKGDPDLRKAVTKTMIEKAVEKSRGNTPSNISEMLSLFTKKSQVSWRKVLRNLMSNEKINKKSTFMRPNRRFPDRVDLKGTIKDRTFNLVAIWDVSGSMSDAEGLAGLNEINSICKTFNTKLKLIQVDTKVRGIEEFTSKTKRIERLAAGGTYIYPAIEYIKENKIPCDGIVIITDGGTEDVSRWERKPKCRTIFLTTDDDVPGIEHTKFQQFKLNVKG